MTACTRQLEFTAQLSKDRPQKSIRITVSATVGLRRIGRGYLFIAQPLLQHVFNLAADLNDHVAKRHDIQAR